MAVVEVAVSDRGFCGADSLGVLEWGEQHLVLEALPVLSKKQA